MNSQGVKAELAAAVRRMADIVERQSRQIETQQEIIEELHVELQMAETRNRETAAGEWRLEKGSNPQDGLCLVTYGDGEIGLIRCIRGSFGFNRDIVAYAPVVPYQAEPEADTAAGEFNTNPDRGWVRVDVAHPIEDGTYPITEIPAHPQNAKPRIGTCFWDSDDCTWVTEDGSNIIAWRNPIKPYQPEEK